ncbi:hypothetical protein D917_01861 [Trichinella nativa]|uniref:Uncharacterized protein n=1 Tax=Trichinella nativa TaxID=6335 RepID=A0A1Y3ENU5_9BILA|nr:hypothetical protein D917_01861 [Trichinella nativa]
MGSKNSTTTLGYHTFAEGLVSHMLIVNFFIAIQASDTRGSMNPNKLMLTTQTAAQSSFSLNTSIIWVTSYCLLASQTRISQLTDPVVTFHTTPSDLELFLTEHGDCFFVRCSAVDLIKYVSKKSCDLA